MTLATFPAHFRPLAEPSGVCAIFLPLLSALSREAVAYCCWKGSGNVARALAGEADLDLLVARQDRQRMTTLLAQYDFKCWPDIAGRDHPALSSFLGYDEISGKLVHIHIHFSLVMGHSLLKNTRLPIEAGVLARAAFHPIFPIRVVDPVDEALIFATRLHLEMRWSDPVVFRHRRRLLQKNAAIRAKLAQNVSGEDLRQRASEVFCDTLASDIAENFSNARSLRSRHHIRSAILKQLAPYRMYGGFEAMLRTFARTALFAARAVNKRYLHWAIPWGRRAPGGGFVIAFAGVDGSGKSTQVGRAMAWLGAEMDVTDVYFGTGDGRASLLLRPFKAMVPLISRFITSKPKGASHGKISDRPPGLLYSLLFAVWATVVAIEKRKKIIDARRAASRGFIVIADRYPQNEILAFNDGPLLPRLPHAPGWLRRFEASAYALAHRTPPDLVIKLQVGPDAVQKREPDMNPALVRQRIAWLEELEFPGAKVVLIDARAGLEEVTRLVKRTIWSIL